jgi:hypothetical protein
MHALQGKTQSAADGFVIRTSPHRPHDRAGRLTTPDRARYAIRECRYRIANDALVARRAGQDTCSTRRRYGPDRQAACPIAASGRCCASSRAHATPAHVA